MRSRKSRRVLISLILGLSSATAFGSTKSDIKLLRVPGKSTAEISIGGHSSLLHFGERSGPWTLMAMTADAARGKWGQVGFSIESHLHEGRILATLDLPATQFAAVTKIRLRTLGNVPLKSVRLNGKPWTNLSAPDETITIPSGLFGKINVVAEY